MLTKLAAELTETARDPCTLELPPNTSQLEELTILYDPDTGAPSEWVQVEGEASCGLTEGTFYVDEQTPPQVRLCPATCNELAASPGTLQVVRGCPQPDP